DFGERSSHQYFAIGMDDEGKNFAAWVWIERSFHHTIQVHSRQGTVWCAAQTGESSAKHNFLVTLDADAKYPSACCARVKTVGCTIDRVQSGDGTAWLATNDIKIATHDNFFIRLNCNCPNNTVRVRVEGGVNLAVYRQKPSDMTARDPRESADYCKVAA